MTGAALQHLLDEELPDVPRHPAPEIPHITAEKRKTMQQPTPVPGPRGPVPTTPAGGTAPPVGKLLAWAEGHETKFVARKGEQARLLLRELRGLYAQAEELAQADAEEQRLEQQLAELRARKERLRPRRKSSAPGYDQAAVRAWARAAGHDVADRGSIPAWVVQAWREATGGAR
ncbi:histone-like nucleoid-structuring protein Lsr2 [Streptomyces sp. NPDC057428]|uniref:Lsr2 family DNA-binding protein n=1 Tax=Streptomyces sp. NPDC057428 TaxID=3346129 RepID=UPI0036CF58DB